MGSETPSLAQTIKDSIEARLAELHTAMPGTIEKFDAATSMASVAPSLKRKYVNGEVVNLPLILNVPVCFPRGGGAAITFDLQKGDPVLLVFSERSIDAWKSLGGLTDPRDPRKHALTDAFAIPGGYPKSSPVSRALINASFTSDGGVKVKNENGFIELAKDGVFKVETPGMRVSFSANGKIELYSKNSSIDFVTQMLLVVDKLVETAKVATSIGLQPLIPDPAYIAERAKLDPFKP